MQVFGALPIPWIRNIDLHISETDRNHIHPVWSAVTRPTDIETEHTLWGPLSLGPETTNIPISNFVKYSVQTYFCSFNL